MQPHYVPRLSRCTPPVACTTCVLLFIIACGTALFIRGEPLLAFSYAQAAPLCAYFALLSLFHLAEFVWTFRFKENSSVDSFLIFQNWPAYQLVIIFSVAEYVVEAIAFPNLKCNTWVSTAVTQYIGIALCMVGIAVRITAMWTAGANFAHMLERPKELVVSGVYGVLRHPSYFGWFYSTVGLSLLLRNPVSTGVVFVMAVRFLVDRIDQEEAELCAYFGWNVYESYARRTFIGIPFVSNAGVLRRAAVHAGGLQRQRSAQAS